LNIPTFTIRIPCFTFKRLPTSQTWHGANELQAAVLKETNPLDHNSAHELRSSGYRKASPLNHSTSFAKLEVFLE
jgi:hypothetical protein